MEDLCTACLCAGRNLHYLGESESYNVFVQILNEISIYNLSNICPRICWECRATVRRFIQFKELVKQSYSELIHVHETSPAQAILAKQSRLKIHNVVNFSNVNKEVEVKDELQAEANVDTHIIDIVKTETIDIEHCEETFVNEFSLENKFKDKKIKKRDKKPRNKSIKTKKKIKLVKSLNYQSSNDENVDVRYSDVDETDDLKNEIDVEEKVLDYGCNECGVVYNKKIDLKKHIKTEHSKKKLNGHNVKKKVIVKTKEDNIGDKPKCVECGKVFSSKKTYRYHLTVLHQGQNRHPCPRCGKVYQWKSNLGRHMRSHKARDTGELHCSVCDKRFASIATYRQHLKVSRRHVTESEFTFMCNECGKKFVNKTRLRDHIDWEHLKKIKFRCQICNKPFKCHTSLYVHMQNVHRDKEKKDNLCHVCGKSYQNAAKLKYHIVAMHTSETPYQCQQCAAAFGWYSSLYRHIREVHYKVKLQPKKNKKPKKSIDSLPSFGQGSMCLQPLPGPS